MQGEGNERDPEAEIKKRKDTAEQTRKETTMNAITINAKNRTIELTKTFAIASQKFGSPEYNELKEARLDNPTYRVVTVAKKTARPKFKGLTYEYMEKYISKHDDEAKSIMGEYKALRAQTEEAEEALAVSASYSDIREWFFDKFPAVAQFHKTRAQILADKKVA